MPMVIRLVPTVREPPLHSQTSSPPSDYCPAITVDPTFPRIPACHTLCADSPPSEYTPEVAQRCYAIAAAIADHPAMNTESFTTLYYEATQYYVDHWNAACLQRGVVYACLNHFRHSGEQVMRVEDLPDDQHPHHAQSVLDLIVTDIQHYVSTWMNPSLVTFFATAFEEWRRSRVWGSSCHSAMVHFLNRANTVRTARANSLAPGALLEIAHDQLSYIGNWQSITGRRFRSPLEWYLLFIQDLLIELTHSDCPPRLWARLLQGILPTPEEFGQQSIQWSQCRSEQVTNLLTIVCHPHRNLLLDNIPHASAPRALVSVTNPPGEGPPPASRLSGDYGESEVRHPWHSDNLSEVITRGGYTSLLTGGRLSYACFT